MLLRYIGKDGVNGLVTGQIYETKVYSRGKALYVSYVIPERRGTRSQAYPSPRALAASWEATK